MESPLLLLLWKCWFSPSENEVSSWRMASKYFFSLLWIEIKESYFKDQALLVLKGVATKFFACWFRFCFKWGSENFQVGQTKEIGFFEGGVKLSDNLWEGKHRERSLMTVWLWAEGILAVPQICLGSAWLSGPGEKVLVTAHINILLTSTKLVALPDLCQKVWLIDRPIFMQRYS